jgi:hypothetical protein
MPLTSSVKELEAILQKLMNLDKSWSKDETNDGRLALLAMRMNFGLLTSVVGSVQQRKRICYVLSRTRKMRKESRLNSVWLKERYKYNIINHVLNRVDTLILRLHTLW